MLQLTFPYSETLDVFARFHDAIPRALCQHPRPKLVQISLRCAHMLGNCAEQKISHRTKHTAFMLAL